MAKSKSETPRTQRENGSNPTSNSNQRIPNAHFDSDGLSEGKQTGAVRPGHDAHNTGADRASRDED